MRELTSAAETRPARTRRATRRHRLPPSRSTDCDARAQGSSTAQGDGTRVVEAGARVRRGLRDRAVLLARPGAKKGAESHLQTAFPYGFVRYLTRPGRSGRRMPPSGACRRTPSDRARSTARSSQGPMPRKSEPRARRAGLCSRRGQLVAQRGVAAAAGGKHRAQGSCAAPGGAHAKGSVLPQGGRRAGRRARLAKDRADRRGDR